MIHISPQDVANAVGAALGTVGGACDLVINLEPIKETLKSREEGIDSKKLDDMARKVALERGRELACNEVIRKGGFRNFVIKLCQLLLLLLMLLLLQVLWNPLYTFTVKRSLIYSTSWTGFESKRRL